MISDPTDGPATDAFPASSKGVHLIRWRLSAGATRRGRSLVGLLIELVVLRPSVLTVDDHSSPTIARHSQRRQVRLPAFGCEGRGWNYGASALLIALFGIALFGCRGSEPDEGKAADAKKKEKEQPAFVFGDLKTLPFDETETGNFGKPGHFVTTSVEVVSNGEDVRADLEATATDSGGVPLLVEDTSFQTIWARPVALPKGQVKTLESTFFIPADTGRKSRIVFLKHLLRTHRGRRTIYEESQVVRSMPASQYFMLVLADNPNEYGFLKQLGAVRPPYDELIDTGDPLLYYRVIMPDTDRPAPLPSHSLAWSGIAYVVWDGMRPELISPTRQQAMTDWLFWGGQLVVSGPGSLATLRGSFLEPYLPVEHTNTIGLGPSEFKTFNSNWSIENKSAERVEPLSIPAESPLVGAEWKLRKGGQFVRGTGELVAESRVGRGRVVVTRFPLSARAVVNWPSFDSFFNACLLRRPRRVYGLGKYGNPQMAWADLPSRKEDPLLSTATRYLSRDAGHFVSTPEKLLSSNVNQRPDKNWHLDGCQVHAVSGVGGWSDSSGVATAAVAALRAAAGIAIPSALFVAVVLAGYVLVLVPLNYLIFRLIGRVEWAWIAAPVIAIIGAAVVIRLAQLDIGFARSRTEINVVEFQAGHSRAHVSRFTALYTSLASAYRAESENLSTVIRPLAGTQSPGSLWPLTVQRGNRVSLQDFQVDSNSTAMLHTEQMLDSDAGFQIERSLTGQWQMRNATGINWDRVGVVGRASDGTLQRAWVGRLPSGSTVTLPLKTADDRKPWFAQWSEHSKKEQDGPFLLEPLLKIASGSMDLRNGDLRLIGTSNQRLTGLDILPGASQEEIATVVVAHLRYGRLPDPAPDVNLLSDIEEQAKSVDKPDALNVLPEDPKESDSTGTSTETNTPRKQP